MNSEKPTERGFFSFLRRGQPWREIFGYHVGDIQETRPVAVAAGSTVVGDIFAPQITVVGLLSGSAISQEVVVKRDGQIWGDIYAVRLHLEPGGLIRGWINTLTEEEYAHWQNGRSTDSDLAPAQLKPEDDHRRDEETLDALRLLQMETAVALAARIELEETFDQRLAEISGETINLLAATREDLKNARTELSAWQEKASDQANTLQQRETQLERQGQELALAQQTLASTLQDLDQLRQTHAQLENEYNDLLEAKAESDRALAHAQGEIDTLTQRVHNIESALKDSLEHSADQEDALVRWQELAQSAETQAREYEQALQNVRQQMEETTQMVVLLRTQRSKAEAELSAAQARMEDLQRALEQETAVASQLRSDNDAAIQTLSGQNERLEAETVQLADEVEQLRAEVEPLRRRNEILMRQMQMAKEKFFRQEETAVALRQQNAGLEKQWQEAQDELARISQQPTKLLTSPQFKALRKEAAQLRRALEETEAAYAAAQTDRAGWQHKATTLEEELSNLSARQQRLEAEMRQKRAQLDASEEDLRRHLQETAVQGQRLAEIQTTLIEREIQLQQAQQRAAKQQQMIRQMKQMAGQRISELEAALARAQHKET